MPPIYYIASHRNIELETLGELYSRFHNFFGEYTISNMCRVQQRRKTTEFNYTKKAIKK
jgi:hypothetical protein